MRASEIDEDLSRRNFLRGVAGAAAGIGAGAHAMNEPTKAPVNNPMVQKLMYWAKQYIKDPAELAAFMSQCAHESANFTSLEEIGSPERFLKKYDIRYNPHTAKKLGNTDPGDGLKYKGRGFLQLTGKWNYEQATKWVNKVLANMNVPQRIDFVNHPELVATPTGGALASLWYWETFSKRRVKNFTNTKQVTKTINPGQKGAKDREEKSKEWQTALNVHPNFARTGKPIRVATNESFGLNYPSTYEQERGPASNTRKQRTYNLTEEEKTLNDIYNGDSPDDGELIWNYIGSSDFDTPLEVYTMPKHKLAITLLSQYRAEHIDDITDMLDDDRKEIVDHYMNDPNLSNSIIVVANGIIVDGNHRALAAVLTNQPIKYVDLDDLEQQE